MRFRWLALLVWCGPAALAQDARLRGASPVYMPAPVDSNSPGYWRDGQFHILNSTGLPLLSVGRDQFLIDETVAVEIDDYSHVPVWIESVWQDDDRTLFAWYHHEPGGVCPTNGLTAPRIGALVSTDGGRNFRDLGIVLSSGDVPDCNARNGFFAGGHGDFSVILDPGREYFYFFFGNYAGEAASQGVAVARMAFSDRFEPVGTVAKYYEGDWTEPGLGGRLTPIFPARRAWGNEDADSFWGPSVHWNTYLNRYVMLLNRACCGPRWPQEGIYTSYGLDLADPASWTAPKLLLKDIGFGPGYYPQVLGTAPGETDVLAGRKARLFVHGVSLWEIEFE